MIYFRNKPGTNVYALIAFWVMIFDIFILQLFAKNYKTVGRILFTDFFIKIVRFGEDEITYYLNELTEIKIDYSNYNGGDGGSSYTSPASIDDGTGNILQIRDKNGTKKYKFQVDNDRFLGAIIKLYQGIDTPKVRIFNSCDPNLNYKTYFKN